MLLHKAMRRRLHQGQFRADVWFVPQNQTHDVVWDLGARVEVPDLLMKNYGCIYVPQLLSHVYDSGSPLLITIFSAIVFVELSCFLVHRVVARRTIAGTNEEVSSAITDPFLLRCCFDVLIAPCELSGQYMLYTVFD